MEPRSPIRRALKPLVVCLLALAGLALPASAGAHNRPLETGIFDSESFYSRDSDLAFARVRDVGAHWARILVGWNAVAPAKLPRSWRPRDPGDRNYDWDAVDKAVEGARKRGLKPLLVVFGTPSWAIADPSCDSGEICAPDPSDFADFGNAIAHRFDGGFDDLPRVQYFQAWNEANIYPFLVPQYRFGEAISPDTYRDMLNGFVEAVKEEKPNDYVLPSGLAPIERPGSVAPMEFMRELLCMGGRRNPYPTCNDVTHFDIWTTHPYTPGSPTRPSAGPDDATLTDLPEMARLLRAANLAGHIDSDFAKVPFWVTEFSWDSRGPDPGGVPVRLHARWAAEALYEMWNAGVSNVFWFLLRDQPGDGAAPFIFQSGLFYRGSTPQLDRPKPVARSFHFPFVAIPNKGLVRIWGRTPDSRGGSVAIQVQSPDGWETVRHMTADRFGIFDTLGDIRTHGWARAVYDGRVSTPYRIERTPSVFQRPFGAVNP